MTKALDAAVRAACESHCTDGVAIENRCTHPKCGCTAIPDLARYALRAALPAEPPAEVIEAMALAGAKTPGMAAIDGALTIAAIHGCTLPKEYGELGNSPMSIAVRAAYRALRAHLLGEDAT